MRYSDMALSDEQKQSFKTQGFLIFKSFFSPAEISRLSQFLDRLRDTKPEEGKEAKYYEKSPITGEPILVRVENLFGGLNPAEEALLITDRVKAILADLLGEPAVLFKEKINYKVPGCRPDKLHQDQAAGWNAYTDFFITMGIMVDANRKDNAALSFLSSGNYKKELMGPEWQVLTHDDPPYKPENEYMLIEGQPGDVIFFDSYVPHGSPSNTSSEARRNTFLTFNRASDGDMRMRYYTDKWKNYAPNKVEDARTNSSYRV
ncbi:MAG: phytanoyl-CoA dioxygenase family protein [Alphaproteobacteria bacterium]|nr:phytanoyl-CoA dioxygenase family protein [Alphaproteobacteria bacterium]